MHSMIVDNGLAASAKGSEEKGKPIASMRKCRQKLLRNCAYLRIADDFAWF